LPVGDEVASQVISLPMGPYLLSSDQTLIAEVLQKHQAALAR
jgi:dTDP-4-amino-4,6-dideoxygalactose transaminase